MSTQTRNLGLTKAADGEYYDVTVVNNNLQKIDDFAGVVNSKLSNSLTFTPVSGFVVTKESKRLINNIMAVGTIEISVTATANTWVDIGTIDAHPYSDMNFTCIRTGNGTFCGMVSIKADGTVRLYSSQGLNGNGISFTFAYAKNNL